MMIPPTGMKSKRAVTQTILDDAALRLQPNTTLAEVQQEVWLRNMAIIDKEPCYAIVKNLADSLQIKFKPGFSTAVIKSASIESAEPTAEVAAVQKMEAPEERILRLEAEVMNLQSENESWGEDYQALTKESMDKQDEIIVLRKRLGEQPENPFKQPLQKLFTMPADMIEPKRIEWLWPYKIPLNKFSILAGNPDQGKSLVSLYIAAQVSRGEPMFGETTKMERSDVLIMAAEDEADDTIRPRLEAANAVLSRIHILQSITCRDGKGKTIADREVQLDTDLQAVETMLKGNPQIKLVIIDPISSFLGRANMNREQEVRSVLTPLKNLAAQCHVAIIAVMHLNKNGDASAIHRIGGAVAFTGVARAVWLFMEDPEDKSRRLMLRVKNNIAKAGGGLAYRTSTKPIMIDGLPEFQPYVEWLGGTEQSASDVLISGAPVGRPADKTDDAKGWLADFLKDGEQLATDVEKFGKRAGHAMRTLNRAKVELKVTSDKIDGRWCWVLPGIEPGKRTVNLEPDIGAE